jgi:hypothetical protein
MAPTDDVAAAAAASPLMATYGTRVDADSAREMLARRVQEAAEDAERAAPPAKAPRAPRAPRRRAPAPAPADGGIGDFLNSTTGRQLQREVIRGVFGLLKRRRR